MTNTQAESSHNLHRKAEEIVQKEDLSAHETLSPVLMKQMIHDLRVRQIELIIQNEEMLSTLHDMRVSHANCEELTNTVTKLSQEIVERGNAQEELVLLHNRLEAQIIELVSELRSKEQAMIRQNSMAAMGEMISNIAHQWRNPLNNVALIIQKVQLDYDDGTLSREDMHSDIYETLEIIQHMSQTIDDFRDFFRIEKDKHEFLISEAVKRALSLVSATLKTHNIQVKMCIDDDTSFVGYMNEYSQVLLNIISNSCDASVERKVSNPVITISVTREKEHSVLYIRDNCGGIADDVILKIYDLYFTTRGHEGTGIGLHMSKVIIEQNMGGQLTVSNIDGGAEFRIEI